MACCLQVFFDFVDGLETESQIVDVAVQSVCVVVRRKETERSSAPDCSTHTETKSSMRNGLRKQETESKARW